MRLRDLGWGLLMGGLAVGIPVLVSQNNSSTPAKNNGSITSSYMPVDIHESFATILARMSTAKPEIMRKHMAVLEERYDLSDRPARGVTMSRGKPLQEGVRVKLAASMTWEKLGSLTPDEIRNRDLFRRASYHYLIPITRKEEWYSRGLRLTKSRSKKTETSRASTWISIYRNTFCPSIRHRCT